MEHVDPLDHAENLDSVTTPCVWLFFPVSMRSNHEIIREIVECRNHVSL